VVESFLSRQAIQRGREIERVESKREDLLLLVRVKFREAISEECPGLIEHETGFELLDTWFRAAVTSDKFDDFLAVFRRQLS